MSDPDIPDEAHERADETFQDIPEKVILAQILVELQEIRRELTQGGRETRETGASDAERMFRCTRCPGEKTLASSKRESHARSEHKTPPGEALSIFEPVDAA